MQYINCFWSGAYLGDLEQICLLSMLRQGHKVRLFSYYAISNAPTGIEICDAREIMPHHELLHHASGSSALGSDRFRYLIMKNGLGVWLDTDVILIKPIPKHDYVFGWEDGNLINGAILYLPPNSPLTGDLCEFVNQQYPIPPFYSDAERSSLEQGLKNGVPVDVRDLPWGVYGPKALTYFIRKNDLLNCSKSPDVFYPVHWRDAHALVSSRYDVCGAITASTVAVHLWNSALRRPSKIRPKNSHGKLIIEQGCFVEKFAREQLGYRVASAVLADASATEEPYSVSRNAACPCGSGKRFKHCHGKYS
jgi:SEC-C motif/Alpha 1,4-glycosyltransferase conserved region